MQLGSLCYLYCLIARAGRHATTIIIKNYVVYDIFVVRNDWFHIKHIYFLYFFGSNSQKRGFFTANAASVFADTGAANLISFAASWQHPVAV